MDKFQFVWYRKWQGIHFRKAAWGMALIFDWYLWLGFLEIRKWHDLQDGDIDRYNEESDRKFNETLNGSSTDD